MPFVSGSSQKVISENIAIERRAGKPADQAAVIAYSKAHGDRLDDACAKLDALDKRMEALAQRRGPNVG